MNRSSQIVLAATLMNDRNWRVNSLSAFVRNGVDTGLSLQSLIAATGWGNDMTGKSYRDELMRVDARPDAEELRRKVAVYHEYYRTYGKAKNAFLEDHADDIEAFQFTYDDPDLGLALAVLCASMYDERDFLFLVAAGPLEDILRKPDQDILARVLAEARKNARFRWPLTGIFLHAISDVARPEIVRALGMMTEADPMPP